MSNESRKQRLMREILGNEERPAFSAETLVRAGLIVAVMAVAGFSSGDFGSGKAETVARLSIQGE